MHQRLPILLALALSALVVGACNDSSPTRPKTPSAQASRIVFADPNALPNEHDLIVQLIEQTLNAAEDALSITGVQVTVLVAPTRAIPGWGMGGYTPNGSEIEIVFDPNFQGLAGVLPTRLPPIVAHEMHHAARWRGPGYGFTLLETMVSEGLADHFAIELLGTPLQPWSDAFPEDRTDFYLARAAPELDSTTFDFNNWFFGPSLDLPRWTGYTLGFRLVRDYMDRHPGTTAASLVNAPADAFRPAL